MVIESKILLISHCAPKILRQIDFEDTVGLATMYSDHFTGFETHLFIKSKHGNV